MREGYINPDCLEDIKVFQRTFVRYFPELDDIQVAASEWSWLYSRWTLNEIETVRRSQATAELAQVVRALRLIAKCDMPWWMSIYGRKRRPRRKAPTK
jgi:hypothetical protein